MAEFFFDLFPSRTLRGFLIDLHIERCPRCQSRLVSREEAGALLVRAGDIGGVENLWPGVRRELEKAVRQDHPARSRSRRRLAWAWGAATVLAAVTGLWLLRRDSRISGLPASNLPGPDRFELEYVRIGGETANAYVYQPQNSDMVLVWAGKSSQGGEQ
jgi:hypothetical protein